MKIKGVIKKTLAILIVFMVVATSVVIPVLTQAQERNEEETIDSKVVNTENGLIKKFDDLGEAKREQNVSLGTSFEDINLPNTLLATVERDGVLQHEEVNVNWESQPKFNSHISGLYTFSPSLTKGYSLDQGITIPQINLWVTMGVVPSSATIDISKEDMDFILPFGLVYDGNQQPNINVQGKGDFNEITGGLVTVFYEGDDYEKSQEPPKNAGTYQISINTTGGTKYKAAQDLVLGSYEIGKATGLVATQPGIIYLSSDDTNVKNYSLDQIQLTAPANCELGALSYATGNFNNDDGILANQPSISNKILSFKGIGGITGTATQVISISSANFETINVNLIFQSAWLEEAKININMPASQPYTNSLIAATASATDENTSQPVPDASFSYIYSGTTITGQHYYSSKMPMKPGDYSVTATLQSATHHGNKQQNFVIAKGTLQ